MAAIFIRTAARLKKKLKPFFLSPRGTEARVARKTFSNESLSRCDRFHEIFAQTGAILATFGPFEIFRAVWALGLAGQWDVKASLQAL